MTEEAEVLYAGKFKSVEELEKGYKESLSVHMKNKELEEKLSNIQAVPESYNTPEMSNLDSKQLEELTEVARHSKMTQAQFDAAIESLASNAKQQQTQWDTRKKLVGEQNINVLKKYVDENFSSYDDGFRNSMLNQIISNDSTMEKAMKDRENKLNSSLPGTNQTGQTMPSDIASGRAEAQKLALRAMAEPNNKEARAKLVNMCRDIGHARMDSEK
jgi:Glu-tRNA(Gln) amidotransferase subunit E-like FAD-binding protein